MVLKYINTLGDEKWLGYLVSKPFFLFLWYYVFAFLGLKFAFLYLADSIGQCYNFYITYKKGSVKK